MHRATTLLAALLLIATPAFAQTRLFQFDSGGSDSYGRSAGIAGDVNQDGLADVIVGASQGDASGASGKGFAEVRSGRDGHVLYTFNGQLLGDNFGWSVSG